MPQALNKGKQASPHAGPQSVGRMLAILEQLADNPSGATLSELAVLTGAPKTSLVGLLTGLVSEGCLVRDETARYALGPRFMSIAMQATAGRELVTVVRPFLIDLVERTGETAVLGALSPEADSAIYLDKVESTNSIRYAVDIGERRDLYSTAVGKLLLAFFEPARLAAYLEATDREQYTAHTITKTRALEAEMAKIREEGIALSFDERVAGASAVAAPIFAHDDTVAGALTVAGPSDRFQANQDAIIELVLKAASDCSRLMGGTKQT